MPSGAIMARKEDTWPARVGDVEDWDVDHVVVEDRIDENVPAAGNQVSGVEPFHTCSYSLFCPSQYETAFGIFATSAIVSGEPQAAFQSLKAF